MCITLYQWWCALWDKSQFTGGMCPVRVLSASEEKTTRGTNELWERERLWAREKHKRKEYLITVVEGCWEELARDSTWIAASRSGKDESSICKKKEQKDKEETKDGNKKKKLYKFCIVTRLKDRRTVTESMSRRFVEIFVQLRKRDRTTK